MGVNVGDGVSMDIVGLGVSVGNDAAIDVLSRSEVNKANPRPTANIATTTPMLIKIARPKYVLNKMPIYYYCLFEFKIFASSERLYYKISNQVRRCQKRTLRPKVRTANWPDEHTHTL
jgi:hypothetical protein